MQAAESLGLGIWGAQGASSSHEAPLLPLRGGGTQTTPCATPTDSLSHMPTGLREAIVRQDAGSKPHQALSAVPTAHDFRDCGQSLARAAGCEKWRGRRRWRRRQTTGWQGHYLELMHHRLLHGHAEVSQTEGGLGKWAAIQR